MVGLLGVAVYTDLRWRRIPNLLTFGVMAAALVVHPLIALSHAGIGAVVPALLTCLAGIAAAFVPGFLFWNLGGAMKAGDAKLLMAAGAVLGPFEIVRVFVLVLFVQIPVGLVLLARAGRLRSLFSVVKAGIRRDEAGPRPLMAPFAGVIAAGYLISRIFPHLLRFWS
jgi:Flp pilus assembly protein protease CpaA